MQPLSTLVFIRALTCAVLFKVLWQWHIRSALLGIHELVLPRGHVFDFLFSPARFANVHPDVFFFSASAFMIVHLLVRRNYFTAFMFSVLNLNLLFVNLPTGNGADPVAFMLSVWAIFMVPPRNTISPAIRTAQTIAYNVGRLCCMLQFVFLYAASGVDKLKSNVWTTASAFKSMRAVGGIINPDFPSWLSTPLTDFVVTWSVIAIEIAFGVLIWFRMWQSFLILSAIMFHLMIWWMLDLPHFAIIMIVALLLFVRDDYYRGVFKPWLLST